MNHQITIVSIKDAGIPGIMPVMTTQILGSKLWMCVDENRAKKLQPVIGKAMSLEKFNELCSIPTDLLDAEDLTFDSN